MTVLLLLVLCLGVGHARSAWTHETLAAVWARPLVLGQGRRARIVVGSEDGFLYAFEPQGRLLWSYKASEGFSGWPASLGAGLIAAGNRNGYLYLFDQDGELKHKVLLDGIPLGPPAAFRNRLFIGTANGRLIAVAGGRVLWSHDTQSPVTGWPVADQQGAVYLGCADGSVRALGPDGEARWRTSLTRVEPRAAGLSGSSHSGPQGVRGQMALAGQEVRAAAADGSLAALERRSGKVRWRVKVEPVLGGVATLGRAQVVLGTDKGLVRAMDERGKDLWSFTADGPVHGPITVAADLIVLGTERGTVYVLDSSGEPQSMLLAATAAVRGGIAVSGERLLFGAMDRRLYVLSLPGRARQRWDEAGGLKAALDRAPRARVLWRRSLSGPVARGVAAGHGGLLLAGTWGRKMFVLNPDGTVSYSYNCGDDVDTLPAASSRGDVVFGCGDGGFYGLKPTGDMRFRLPVNKALASSPAVAQDGTIYFGAGDRRLYALDKNGTIRWRVLTGDEVDSAPRVAPDGVVYVGSDDRHLYAVDPLGNVLWYASVGGPIRTRPALGADGTIYFTSFDQRLWALSQQGKKLWSFQTSGQLVSSPVVGQDGTLFFGSRDHDIYAVSGQGALRWRFETAGEVDSTFALVGEDMVVAGSDDGNVYALAASTGQLRWWHRAGAEVRGRILARADGSVVLGTMDGAVLALSDPGQAAGPGQPSPARPDPGPPVLPWHLELGQEKVGPFSPGERGSVVIAGWDGVVRAVGSDKWPLWSVRVGRDPLSPMVRLERDLYLTDASGNLAAVREGVLRFRLRLERLGLTPPAVLATVQGPLILVGGSSGRVWAVTPGGKVRWLYSGSAAISGVPLPLGHTRGGAVVVVAASREVIGLDSSGNQVWAHGLPAGVLSGPVALGRKILVGHGLGGLVALDSQGKEIWRKDLGAAAVQLDPCPGGGSVLGRTADGRVVEVAGSGEWLLDVPLPAPAERLALTPAGLLYLVGADGSVSRMDRRTGRLDRLAELSAPSLDARGLADGGLALVSEDGQVSLLPAPPAQRGGGR